jgi:TonB family protein
LIRDLQRGASTIAILLMSCVWLNTAVPAQSQGASNQLNLTTIPPDKAKENLVTFIQPDYPPLAKAAGIAGIIHVSFEVDETGSVKNLKLISGHPMLAPAALAAIRKWKYKPFEVDGKSAAVQTEVEVSIPENISQADIDKERKFQDVYWPSERAGREAMKKGDFVTAESKLLVAKSAAEERGDQKWLELADTLSVLGTVKLQQNRFQEAEQFYKDSLTIHEKHQRPDEAEVAGVQEQLGLLYMRAGQPEKAEPFLQKSVQSYEARIEQTSMPEAKAGYGQSLALGYFGLSQIARANGRLQEFHDRCGRALNYADKWSSAADKEVIVSNCAGSSK